MNGRWHEHHLAETALQVFAIECEVRGHAWCAGDCSCGGLLDDLRANQETTRRAIGFDAMREASRNRIEQPSSEWTTTALLRTTLDLIVTPPSENWLWRSVAITTALARLGERGLSPDAILRTGFRRDLLRRVLLDASAFLSAEGEGHLERDEIPWFLQDWCDLLRSADASAPPGAPVVFSGLPPEAAVTLDQWCNHAAVAHLLGWRIKDYLHVDRTADDMVLAGGKDATVWVCDRLTRTYLTEWTSRSLQWELAYGRAPNEISIRAGVDPAILAERTVTEDMLVRELSSRLVRPGSRDEVGDVAAEELVPSLALMLKEGKLAAARAQSRRAYHAYPQDPTLSMAYAFCTIPHDRAEARRILADLKPERAEDRALVAMNLAVCELFDGECGEAVRHALTLEPVGLNESVWLWDPQEASEGRAALCLELFEEWLPRLRSLVQST